VRNGATAPNVATVDALKQALLAADSVVYNSASSGLYLDTLFEKMGVLAQIKPKTTRYPDGASVMEHVIKGKGNEIGFGAITEIKLYTSKGLQFVGPLPPDAQNYTTYEAALMTGAPAADAAKAVLRQLATPAGQSRVRVRRSRIRCAARWRRSRSRAGAPARSRRSGRRNRSVLSRPTCPAARPTYSRD
jgi:molybdate transport system substrate-binding protein